MRSETDWEAHLPIPLQRLLNRDGWEADTWGCSGTSIYHIGQHYLKIAAYQRESFSNQSLLEAEAARLRWLEGRLRVPQVQYYGHDEQYEFLLLEELPGLVSCDEAFGTRVPAVIQLLAQGLHLLQSVEVTDCPFDATIDRQLEHARRKIALHLIDPTMFLDEFQGMSPEEVYALLLKLRPQHEARVLTHGDYCLPNILLDQQLTRITGFIDWGRAGIADPYQDLALAARSLARNFGAQWVPLLFEAYGIPHPDEDALKFYRALDQLT